MEKSSKRGKIPQSDWPLIMARYEAGETLASIARTYDCSPPAISYVVSRSRTRPGVTAAKTAAVPDPRLVKSAEPELVVQEETEPKDVKTGAVMANGQSETPAPEAQNGSGANGHGNGEHRRTLHLSLGQQSHTNAAKPAESGSDNPGMPISADGVAALHPAATQPEGPGAPQPYHRPAPPQQPYAAQPGFAEAVSVQLPSDRITDIRGPHRKDAGGTFIGSDLRARVNDDIAAFLAAFDAALLQDNEESRSGLREATDRLLRAGERTRIELERLEARIPLPSRQRPRYEPAWRSR